MENYNSTQLVGLGSGGIKPHALTHGACSNIGNPPFQTTESTAVDLASRIVVHTTSWDVD